MPVRADDALKAFLEHSKRPVGTLRYHELHGFLFAVVCAPELVRPSEWLPIVFDGQEAEYETLEEAQVVVGSLMKLYNDVNGAVTGHRPAFPPNCRFRADTLANLEEDAPVAQWSRGFIRGHQWLEDVWDGYVPEKLDERFSATLMALTFFASRKLAEAFLKETKHSDLRTLANTVRSVFYDAVEDYAHVARSIRQVLAEQRHAPAQPARRIKVGRNEPCPCGSGRKYKVCCGTSRSLR